MPESSTVSEGGEATALTPLQIALRDCGLSEIEVAQRAGICVPYLRRIVRGRGTPAFPRMERLARILRCDGILFVCSNRVDSAKKRKAKGK